MGTTPGFAGPKISKLQPLNSAKGCDGYTENLHWKPSKRLDLQTSLTPQTYQTNQRTCFVIPRSLQNHAPICSPAPIRINSHARRFAIEREHLQTGCIFSCEKRIHIHPNSSMIFAPLSKVKSMEALSCRIYSSPFQWFSLAQHVQFGPCREPILSVNTDPSNWALASYSWRQSKTLLSNSLRVYSIYSIHQNLHESLIHLVIKF